MTNFSAQRALKSLCMGIVVMALLHVIVYLWKPPQKAWQVNFARKINEVLNGGNFVQQDDSSRQSRNYEILHRISILGTAFNGD